MTTEPAADATPLPGDSSLTLSFKELVHSDVAALRGGTGTSWLSILARLPFVPGVLASLILRAQQVLHRSGRSRAARLLQTVGNVLVGADFGPGMVIGPGLRLMHPVGVTMGWGARVGANVTFAGGVTLAARYYDEVEGTEQAFPVIEDNAMIGAHSVLVGGVRIGRNSVVGANSVVISDVPPNTVVLGVPARKVGTRNEDEAGQ